MLSYPVLLVAVGLLLAACHTQGETKVMPTQVPVDAQQTKPKREASLIGHVHGHGHGNGNGHGGSSYHGPSYKYLPPSTGGMSTAHKSFDGNYGTHGESGHHGSLGFGGSGSYSFSAGHSGPHIETYIVQTETASLDHSGHGGHGGHGGNGGFAGNGGHGSGFLQHDYSGGYKFAGSGSASSTGIAHHHGGITGGGHSAGSHSGGSHSGGGHSGVGHSGGAHSTGGHSVHTYIIPTNSFRGSGHQTHGLSAHHGYIDVTPHNSGDDFGPGSGYDYSAPTVNTGGHFFSGSSGNRGGIQGITEGYNFGASHYTGSSSFGVGDSGSSNTYGTSLHAHIPATMYGLPAASSKFHSAVSVNGISGGGSGVGIDETPIYAIGHKGLGHFSYSSSKPRGLNTNFVDSSHSHGTHGAGGGGYSIGDGGGTSIQKYTIITSDGGSIGGTSHYGNSTPFKPSTFLGVSHESPSDHHHHSPATEYGPPPQQPSNHYLPLNHGSGSTTGNGLYDVASYTSSTGSDVASPIIHEPYTSYLPPPQTQAHAPHHIEAVSPHNTYLPPPPPQPQAALSNSYLPPPASRPINSYLPPGNGGSHAQPSNTYLPPAPSSTYSAPHH